MFRYLSQGCKIVVIEYVKFNMKHGAVCAGIAQLVKWLSTAMMSRVSSLVGAQIFLFSVTFRLVMGCTQPSVHWAPWALYLRIEQQRLKLAWFHRFSRLKMCDILSHVGLHGVVPKHGANVFLSLTCIYSHSLMCLETVILKLLGWFAGSRIAWYSAVFGWTSLLWCQK